MISSIARSFSSDLNEFHPASDVFHSSLDDFISGSSKKNQRWTKIIHRSMFRIGDSKKKTQRSTIFYHLFGPQRASPKSFGHVAKRVWESCRQ
jgi:hypothetical protein